MNKLLNAMSSAALFSGLDVSDCQKLIKECGVSINSYEKGEFILRRGDVSVGVGIMVSGSVNIIREDFLGNREIIAKIEKGDIFSEVYALLREERLNVSAVAASDCETAFFPAEVLMNQRIVAANLVKAVASKNLMLTNKMEHLSKRTVRGKIISYLSEISNKTGDCSFSIPFDRQQLADYLAVDRSALSRELCKMRDEGLIKFYKNKFVLYNTK